MKTDWSDRSVQEQISAWQTAESAGASTWDKTLQEHAQRNIAGYWGEPGSGDGHIEPADIVDADAPGGPGKKPAPTGTGTPRPLDNLGDQFDFKKKLIEKFGEDGANDWLRGKGSDGRLDGVARDSGGRQAILYDSEFDRLYKDFAGTQAVLQYNHVVSPNDKGGSLPPNLLGTLGNQFGLRNKVLEINGNDVEKANAWLFERGYRGHADGLTKDVAGREAVRYGSPFDGLLRQAYGTERPWEEEPRANYVSGDNAAGSATLPEPDMGSVEKNLKQRDPALWERVKAAFRSGDDANAGARRNYMETVAGLNQNKSLDDSEMKILAERFGGDKVGRKVIMSAEDFKRGMKNPELFDDKAYARVKAHIEGNADDPYTLDALFHRYAGADGRLDKNELDALYDSMTGKQP